MTAPELPPCLWCAGEGVIAAGEVKHWKVPTVWPEHTCPDCGGAGVRAWPAPRAWPKK